VSFESDQLHLWCWPRCIAIAQRRDIVQGVKTTWIIQPISCETLSSGLRLSPAFLSTAYALHLTLHPFPAYICLLRQPLTIRYNDDLSLEDAIHTALLTLKEGFEGQMTEHTIEIGVVTVPTAEQMQEKPGERLPPTFRKLSEQEVRDYLAL